MLKSGLLPSTKKLRAVRACVGALCVLGALHLPALSQNFTLVMQPFPSPAAINPGGTTAASITVSPLSGFNGTVDLSCQVTLAATGQVVDTLACDVTPSSVAPPATASATITTSSTNSPAPGLYTVTVTGTASGTSTSAKQNLTVLAVTPQFTITAEQVEPSSVHAGSGGEGTISINPIYGYVIPSGGITLSCASITPLVNVPPECSFSPNPLTGSETSSTLRIITVGPITAAPVAHPRFWYAVWLPLPMLVLAGMVVVSGKRSRRAWCLFALVLLGGTMLLLPACGTTPPITPTTTNGQITPKNTYTFTLLGVDANGVVSSNTGTSAASVTLTVN
jgi:hypothetical protein